MITEAVITNTPAVDVPTDYLPDGATAHTFELVEGLDRGKRLFYYDCLVNYTAQDVSDDVPTVLFVHGNPESSYTFRETVGHLIELAVQPMRIIAMDHIGFGLSDQATFEMVDIHHAANLEQLIVALDLNNVTLVIHDWGGAIGIGALINMAQRVNNLVLMNTTVFPIPQQGMNYTNFPIPIVMPWHTIGHVVPKRWWGYVAALVMGSGVGKWKFLTHSMNFLWRALNGKLTAKERFYQVSLSTIANAKSSMRNVKQTKHWGHGYQYDEPNVGNQDNHQFYQNIQQQIALCWGPEGRNIGVRAYFGLWDPLARVEVQQQWLDALPQLKGQIATFSDAGHFVEEVKFEQIAQGIAQLHN